MDLSDAEATRAVQALGRAGIAAESVPERRGHVVEVGITDAARALSVLRVQQQLASAPSLLDSMGEPSIVPSRLSERTRLAAGLAGELERTLLEFEGVSGARVHVALPEDSPLAGAHVPRAAKASVVVATEADAPLPAEEGLRKIATGAIPGLEADAVHIVFVPRKPSERRELARIGPITTNKDGLFAARTFVVAAVGTNLLLLGLVLLLWRRSASRLESRVRSEP